MNASVTVKTKLTPEEKRTFVETCEALGVSTSCALKVLIRKFNEVGGFPFEVRRIPAIDFNHPNLYRPKVDVQTVVLPASCRDDDENE